MLARLKENWKKTKLNPFSNVPYGPEKDNTEKAPHSRTLHTSFWKKMVDTFYVFAGVIQRRMGLIDYATLGIFKLITELGQFLAFIDDEKLKVEKNYTVGKKAGIYVAKALLLTAGILVFAINLCSGLIHYGVSAVATLALSPVVFFSHVVSEMVGYFKARNLARKFKSVTEYNAYTGLNIDTNYTKYYHTSAKLFEQLSGASLRKVQVEAIEEAMALDSSVNRIAKIVTFVIPDPKSGSTKKVYGRFYKDDADDMKQFDSLVEINPTARQKANYECRHYR